MLRYALRRFFYMILTLWLVVSATFFLMKSLPGDPFGEEAMKLTEEQRKILYAQYGLDKPLWQQYLKFLNDTAHGDLGVSYTFPTQKVTDIIKQSFPASLELGLWALLIAVVIGLFLGIIAALNHNKGPDFIAMLTALIGISIPSFILAPILSYWVGVKLGWLPVGLWNGPSYRVLPSVALSLGTLAIVARMMRTSMLDVLNQDYIKTARAKGLSGAAVVTKHTVRNAIMPVITILGPTFVNLITGTLIVEQIFVVPGLGKHFVQSIYSNDYTMITGLTIFYSFILMVVLFLTDMIYGLVDPRIRLARGGKR
jgi:oligopeptide transport system permease protein